jgi:hypothetical protein
MRRRKGVVGSIARESMRQRVKKTEPLRAAAPGYGSVEISVQQPTIRRPLMFKHKQDEFYGCQGETIVL